MNGKFKAFKTKNRKLKGKGSYWKSGYISPKRSSVKLQFLRPQPLKKIFQTGAPPQRWVLRKVAKQNAFPNFSVNTLGANS